MNLFAAAAISGPKIDWMAISPLVALIGGACVVLLAGLLRSPLRAPDAGAAAHARGARRDVRARGRDLGRQRQRDLGRDGDGRPHAVPGFLFCAAAAACVLLAWQGIAPREAGHGEFHALLLTVVLGMFVLAGATNLVTVFIGYELLSIPLYVLCATEMRRERSLESGLKYLIIGSVGSATLLYGLAFVYGATGGTSFTEVADGVATASGDALLLTGLALVVAGLAFKASVAPFHQWTPDVYEGAPTPITAFMAVATKAAAFGVILRFFDVAVVGASDVWAPALAVLAVVTIVVGNVGAIGQSSLKRLLAYSSVAQAGYMLAGVVVTTQLRDPRRRLLPRRLPADEPGGVRGDRRPRARDRARRRGRLALRARREPAGCSPGR